MTRLCLSPRVLRFWMLLLAVFEIASLLIATERPAQAYVDPGSGFVFLQVAGSMCVGALYYLRHRVKRLLYSLRRSPDPAQTAVVENRR
ncbi:MAG: hypothetical protein WA510_26250 [Acidobacteriaceae bacterium]